MNEELQKALAAFLLATAKNMEAQTALIQRINLTLDKLQPALDIGLLRAKEEMLKS